jgi:broad specificity phosphatase PhoE
MARIYMVRHGHAAAGFDNADPSLDGTGHAQAEEAARALSQRGPLSIVTSPLARARETARPLALLWHREPVVDERVAEIPTPQHLSLTERVPWLRGFMAGTWREADPSLEAWRRSVIGMLTPVSADTVVFSHFIAINVGVGHVAHDDRVVVFAPDNCSITIFETDGTSLRVIERGRQAATRVG